MKKDVQQEREWAVERFYTGERAHSICVSLDHSRSWLYKWLNRAATDDPLWYQDQSRRPLKPGQCTPAEIEELVKLVRLSLYNNDLFCGAQALQWELNDRGVLHVPSVRTINRILARQDLTNRRTGRYQSKGKAYLNSSLVIVDEVGYLPVTSQEAYLFFQFVTYRYEKSSTLITSNKSFSDWQELFGDPVIASAILDRLLHHCGFGE